jgi:tetratricopeptide (TPR) repeat protein
VKPYWQISAGAFFELLRPAAIVLSALLSAWVLASARRLRFRIFSVAAWTLLTFLYPVVVLPIYLIVRMTIRQRQASQENTGPVPVKFPVLVPASYLILLLSLIGVYIYRDYQSIDAQLARAAQAKVMNQRDKTIREYRAALRAEDNPHTHKLLGIELAADGQWGEALKEFRAAELGHEPDPSLPFFIGEALEKTGKVTEAISNYRLYGESSGCRKAIPDSNCELASQSVVRLSKTPQSPVP